MAETLVKPETSEPLFGKKERLLITDPLNDNNPITVQVLGICSALAVTSLLYPSIVMAIAVIVVTSMASVITSLLRKNIPKSVRLIVQLIIIATLVTVVELTLKAFSYPVYKNLSVYIGLIITNCIIMGRLEAFSMANNPWRSFLDGLGNGIGYGAILIVVAFFRELFGKGTLFAGTPIAMNIIGPSSAETTYWLDTNLSWLSWYTNNNLAVLPAAAMFIIGILIWVQRSKNTKLVGVS